MINKIKNTFKAYMIRPMIYKTIMKISLILVICLMWDQWINVSSRMNVVKDAFFIVGFIWMLLAWFQYLKLDGYTVQYVLKDKQKEKEKKHKQKDIVDFVDEEIISFDELEEDEKTIVNMFSNLIAGFLYVVISLFFVS